MILEVKKGNHYCNWLWSILSFTFKKKLNFTLGLLGGWDYEYRNYNDKDTSKIFRLSDSFHHLRDSVGLGINKKEDGSLWLRTIIHRDSKIITKEICKAYPDVIYDCSISISKNIYVVKVNDFISVESRSSKYVGLRYILGLMSGGNLLAPNDLSINIKMI